ncbi:MAG: DNA integrity scanning protein DisA nucleotide-binding domain protein [Clostridia bacterium]|nr:DNA integrity scanning protein DisA nucleotide-binding domain protein [Clostridia bacterium]
MVEQIIQFFQNIDATKIATAITLWFVLFCSFSYAKKANMVWLAIFETLVIFAVFGLSFLNPVHFDVLVYIVLLAIVLCNVSLLTPEIRHDLFKLTRKQSNIPQVMGDVLTEDLNEMVEAITKTCQDLSKNDVGALIVIADSLPDSILDSGTRINADVSAELLEALFYPKAPLHDGAVIISGNKIIAAGCYLPLTQTLALPKELGTRHRAALGICETDPALTAIVVSEETGIISAMHDGKIKRYLDVETLEMVLHFAVGLAEPDEEQIIWGE